MDSYILCRGYVTTKHQDMVGEVLLHSAVVLSCLNFCSTSVSLSHVNSHQELTQQSTARPKDNTPSR